MAYNRILTGLILKLKLWNQVREKEYYSDGDYFETPGDYDFMTRVMQSLLSDLSAIKIDFFYQIFSYKTNKLINSANHQLRLDHFQD